MERLVSIFGLVALMGIAWAFSAHRRAVSWRTVFWGVGLQILLAVIILAPSVYSYGGMFLLMSLLLLYIFEQELAGTGLPKGVVPVVTLLGAAAVLGGVYKLLPQGLTLGLFGLAVVAFLAAVKMEREHAARLGFAATMVLGVASLWQREIDGEALFEVISGKVAMFLSLSDKGADFLFANLADRSLFFVGNDSAWPGFGFQFAFTVLPTIIFFSAFMSVMYYLGIVQVVIGALARFMRWSMRTSGSETMSCSGNIFVGQTESPFLIKPFLKGMTTSELHAVMVGGFATIAGGVLAGYIQMGVNPGHLIAASVMSAPAALVIAKLLYPETEESETSGETEMPEIPRAENMVEAATAGTTDGLKLALNVGAMLIAFIALIEVVDVLLGALDTAIDGKLLAGWLGGEQVASAKVGTMEYDGIFPGTLATFFGTVLAPLAWIMGVPWSDAAQVGNLLGIKLTVNEFVSYGVLSEYINGQAIGERAQIIATYALCGFANFSSIGIQIGGISALAPERRKDLSRIGVRAMCGGALASWMTATIAGILL